MTKKKGDITDVFFAGIIFLALCIFIVGYLNFYHLIDARDQVGEIGRKAIIQLETQGYLNARDIAILKSELEDIGAYDIDLEGTSVVDVGYGNPVYLCIRCKFAFQELNSGSKSSFDLFFADSEKEIYIQKESIAKN